MHHQWAERLLQMLQVAAVWTWLAQRFGSELFPGIEEVRDTTREMVQLMEQGLQVRRQTALLPPQSRQWPRPCCVQGPGNHGVTGAQRSLCGAVISAASCTLEAEHLRLLCAGAERAVSG